MQASVSQIKSKYYLLCSIAVEVDDYGGEQTSNPHLFKFLKKSWRIKDEFAAYTKLLIDAIVTDCEEPKKKVCFIPVQMNNEMKNAELFVASSKAYGKTNELEHKVSCAIFPIIFKEYVLDLEQHIGFREHDHLELVYVTNDLFKALHERHKENTDLSAIKFNLPNNFKPKLRKYQEQSVKWLLMRETVEHKISFKDRCQLLESVDGTKVYKDKNSISFYEDDDPMISKEIVLPPGGILADEMGLGKTVEILALIMLNRRTDYSTNTKMILDKLHDYVNDTQAPPTKRLRLKTSVTENLLCFCCNKSERNTIQCSKCKMWQHKDCVQNHVNSSDIPYICPQCWPASIEDNLIESGATFIVTPRTIQSQWVSEIKKHTNPNLRIHCYRGIGAKNYIDPYHLSKYDIVLTEYNILRREIYHTDEYKCDREGRYKPRFLKAKSPLLYIQWWRVCLDEAQMVESNTSNAAELAHMLPAIIRWAVTGTPIQRTLHDISPLLNFLNFNVLFEPMSSWEAKVNAFLLNISKEPLIDILHQSMWRTCKLEVQNEIDIPKQGQIVHRFNMSNIETLHYRNQHKKNFEKFVKNLTKHLKSEDETLMANVSPALLKILLQPLLKTRQCCTIPVIQTISGEAREQFLQPKDLLEHMKNTTHTECKTLLRTWASACNGLASAYATTGDYNKTMLEYMEVVHLGEKYKGTSVSVDSLLQIHALHNALDVNEFTAPRILSEETCLKYREMRDGLSWHFRMTSRKSLNTTRIAYQESQKKFTDLQKRSRSNLLQFLSEMIEKIYANNIEEGVLRKIQDECMAQGYYDKKINKVSTLRGILYIIDVWYNKVEENLSKITKMLDKLKFFTEEACESEEKFRTLQERVNQFVAIVSKCHLENYEFKGFETLLRLNFQKPDKKGTCELCRLFTEIKDFEKLLVFTDSDFSCMEIYIIKVFLNHLRTKTIFIDFNEEFSLQLESIECLQNICRKLVKFWIEIDFSVKAFDELEMCKTRLTVIENENERTKYCFTSDEINITMCMSQYDKNTSSKQFNKIIGRLKYLEHLNTDLKQYELNCPICAEDGIDHYVVLQCGHMLCYFCTSRLMQTIQGSYPVCPVCRRVSSVYYSLRFFDEKKPVKGDFSTKIVWIVSAVLTLLAENPSVKILIFSQWPSILKEISNAFTVNKICHRRDCSPKPIDDFKDPKLNVTCLLMPFLRGSKGLNLTEATHVFLVEPILNPSEELQAIGRVHRLGQTKPTTVHRFIAKETIEEKLYNFITGSGGHRLGSGEETPANNESEAGVPSTPAIAHWELGRMSCKTLKELFNPDKLTSFFSSE